MLRSLYKGQAKRQNCMNNLGGWVLKETYYNKANLCEIAHQSIHVWRPWVPVLKKGTTKGYILRTGFSYWDLIFELKIEVMLLQKEPGRNANQHLGRDRIGKETIASCLLDGSTHSNTGLHSAIRHQSSTKNIAVSTEATTRVTLIPTA